MPFHLDPAGILRVREFEDWPWLAHAFSTRAAGNLGRSAGNTPAELQQNQARFMQSAGADGWKLLTLRQIHSTLVRVVDRRTAAGLKGDVLLTNHSGLLLGIKTADCLPVLLVDPLRQAVAAIHAGWRGIARRVVEKAVGEMRRQFGSSPQEVRAAIGPGIQACCFEVGPEVLDEFATQFVDADRYCRRDAPNPALTMIPKQLMDGRSNALLGDPAGAGGHIDLAEAVRSQLVAAGTRSAHIYNSGQCTACEPSLFYSYRREKEAAGRMMAVVGLRTASRHFAYPAACSF